MDLLEYEKKLYEKGYNLIGGIDEVGRGPLVGPVVAACCILPKNYYLEGLNDSKKLTGKKREALYKILVKDAISFGIGIINERRIDEINIYEATKEAMLLAVKACDVKPEYLLIDAMKLNIKIPFTSIIKGDAKSSSIAAASIIAKVTRDKMMIELDSKYPMYGFKNHKGYATKMHVAAVKEYGVIENYRFTFKPISDLINAGDLKNESQS